MAMILENGYREKNSWNVLNSKKIEKLSNEQPMNAIAKCTLAGLVQNAKKSHQKLDLKLCMHI